MSFIGLLDLAGIQRFLFRNERLRDIGAASALIEALSERETGLFAREARSAGAEMLVAAGGNAALLADDAETLKHAFRRISRALLLRGDGLQIVCAVQPYDDGALAEGYHHAIRQLERRKFSVPRDTTFTFSGLEPFQPLAPPPPLAELKPAVPPNFVEPADLGRMICASPSEKFGLMAVVSVDGIGMGKRLIAWMQDHRAASNDVAFREEYTAWSESLKTRWRTAWEAALREIARQFAPPEFALEHAGRQVRLQRDGGGRLFLPCRHIYQGGDDLTFVCDARLALSLTAFLVRTLENLPPGDGVPARFHRLTASAGVVYVDAHFPFVRAVRLAETMQKAAKKKAVEISEEAPPSVIDWWVNRQGAMERPAPSYPGASLKPYPLHSGGDPFTFEVLEKEVLAGLTQTYADARNKAKDLLIAASEGRASVRRLLRLRPLPPGSDFGFIARAARAGGALFAPEDGFEATGGMRTPLIDAGEVSDLHFPFGA